MDDTTLKSLEQALQATPENLALRMVLVRARLDRQETELAASLLHGRDLAELVSAADRLLASEALLAAGQAGEALAAARGDEPAVLIARARALLSLDRAEEARDAYRRAVEENAALEDPALAARLGAEPASARRKAAEDADERRPRLRVLEGGDKSDALDPLVAPAQARVTFDDVGGLDEVKRQLRRRVVTPFLKPSLFRRFGKRVGGGILLYGPPGCGKTLLARATAGECEASFFNVALSDVLDMWLGESEAKLHALFAKARASAPSVLFFDEIEALGGKRQYSRDSSLARLVSQFLSEMDGFQQANDGVLVLGATNLPWAVDQAFMRPGRFDRFLLVPPPDRAARETILKLQLRDRPTTGQLNVATLAHATSGFSGADLKGLVETAADLAIEESLESGSEVPIRMSHLEAALAEVRATTVEWLTTARNHARYANESGQYDDLLAFLRRHGNG